MAYDLFSADDHVIEHGRVWTDRVPAKFCDAAPRVDRILWECDYPHVDTPWPRSQQAVEEVLGALPSGERDAICHENAETLFRWEMAPLPASSGAT